MNRPTIIQIFRCDDGRYSWEVCFDDADLNQDGFARSYEEAMQCVQGAVENAAAIVEVFST